MGRSLLLKNSATIVSGSGEIRPLCRVLHVDYVQETTCDLSKMLKRAQIERRPVGPCNSAGGSAFSSGKAWGLFIATWRWTDVAAVAVIILVCNCRKHEAYDPVFVLTLNVFVEDKVVGAGLLAVAGFIFVYYTIWVILLPFVDTKEVIHSFFPPRIYAIAIPTALLAAFVSGVTLFIGIAMVRAAAKERSKSKQA